MSRFLHIPVVQREFNCIKEEETNIVPVSSPCPAFKNMWSDLANMVDQPLKPENMSQLAEVMARTAWRLNQLFSYESEHKFWC